MSLTSPATLYIFLFEFIIFLLLEGVYFVQQDQLASGSEVVIYWYLGIGIGR